jgi:hypothetical protein
LKAYGEPAEWVQAIHGELGIDQPFLELPKGIASPHRSRQSAGKSDICLRLILGFVRAQTGVNSNRIFFQVAKRV